MRFHQLLSVFRYTLGAGRCAFALAVCLLIPLSATGQVNPVPFVSQPLVPAAIAPGGPGLTLTVNGTGFVTGAVVNWNGSVRTTNFVSSSQLTAAIPASDIATAGTASITVLNPGPGGGLSNVGYFDITSPASTLTFARLDTYGASDVTPGAAIAADFNGDGKLDLAITQTGSVSVLLGNGDGTFSTHADYPAGTNPSSVVAADFNGDGKLDLAAANCYGDTVSILLGRGDGTFQPQTIVSVAQPSGTATQPVSLVAGDFNGDGKLDLAVALQNSKSVSILLGNGDGTFQNQVLYAADLGPSGITTGDFNGDGELDLAVSNGVGTVSILLGNGDGTFQAQATFPGAGLVGVITADVNKDGKLDLILVMDTGASSGVSVLLGNGDGTFQPGVDYTTGYATLAAAVGDFNADGNLDLAVPIPFSRTLSIFLGNGDGTFQNPVQFVFGAVPGGGGWTLAVGDFNGDGKLDLAIPSTFSISITTLTMLLQGQLPALRVSPPILAFAQQLTGTTSPPQTVTLTNTGTATMSISDMAISGANADDFSQSNTCNSTLAVGADCQTTVTFTPTGGGNRTAMVGITDDAPGSPQTITLTGTGLQAAVMLAPMSLTFANQPVATTSGAQSVTLSNSGTATLNISSVTVSGDFALTSATTCPSSGTVAVGASCSISVNFTPGATGLRTGSISISDDAPGSPQTVSLTGTGTGPAVSLSPTSLAFGDQFVGTSSLPQNVTLTNTGDAQLTITSVQASTSFAATSGCTSNVPPGVNCTIGVFFGPSAVGSVSGTLTITDNAPGSPHTVALSGTGTDFTLAAGSGSSTSATVTAGQTANYTLSMAGSEGFSGSAALVCSGAPSLATCTVSPASVALTGTTPASVTVRVTTTGRSMVPPLGRHRGLPLQVWLLVLAALTTFAAARKRRVVLSIGGAMLLVVLWAACGGGGGGGGGGGNPGTPPGTYTLTVTGTVSTGSGNLSHDITLTLKVN